MTNNMQIALTTIVDLNESTEQNISTLIRVAESYNGKIGKCIQNSFDDNKAPGPDGLTFGIVKEINSNNDLCFEVSFSRCLGQEALSEPGSRVGKKLGGRWTHAVERAHFRRNAVVDKARRRREGVE
ncbi:hypothetical protein NPIL_696461 [Nephila pilipes]|uniref:Uncharacterized protein n=1 Tax=Nephila pilipes TaxID=299642 RepID=A0A8X6R3R5_NEPPI|nr:hypothetical protein NPIL_696461 [Nephila pilipes]